jgi:hypothetical protein
MKRWQFNAIAAMQTGQTFSIQNSSASPFSANRRSSSAILETPARQSLQLGARNLEKRL